MKTVADFNPFMFRAYDIRGEVGPDLNEETVEAIARAFSHLVATEDNGQLVVGGDNRASTPQLKSAFIRGIADTGCDVVDIGLSTSPLLYFCVASWHTAGGVNITGSHNPQHHNGLKLIGPNGIPISSDQIQEIRHMVGGRRLGRIRSERGSVVERDPKEEYLQFVEKYVTDKAGRPKAGYRVVVDGGNGVASLLAPQLLRRLGCDVIELYCDLDTPKRELDPTDARNLGALRRRVLETRASLGIAFDGDGDRLGIVGPDGVQVEPEYVLIILARDFLRRNPGAVVLYDVRCSSNVPRDILEHGGKPYMFKSGHSLIKREMREKGILFAGEGSGHVFFGEDYFGVESGILAAASVVSIVSNSGKDIHEHFADLPRMASSPEFRLKVPDEKKFEWFSVIAQKLKANRLVSEVDGVRVEFEGGWALVRPSNTNPEIICRTEAEDQDRLKMILEVVQDVLAQVLPPETLREMDSFRRGLR